MVYFSCPRMSAVTPSGTCAEHGRDSLAYAVEHQARTAAQAGLHPAKTLADGCVTLVVLVLGGGRDQGALEGFRLLMPLSVAFVGGRSRGAALILPGRGGRQDLAIWAASSGVSHDHCAPRARIATQTVSPNMALGPLRGTGLTSTWP
jgi:hypothetical protein